jgi:hypothetical protein
VKSKFNLAELPTLSTLAFVIFNPKAASAKARPTSAARAPRKTRAARKKFQGAREEIEVMTNQQFGVK